MTTTTLGELSGINKITIDQEAEFNKLVKKDWASIHESLKTALRKLIEGDIIPGIAQKYTDKTHLELALALNIDGRLLPNKNAICSLLKDFPDTAILQIIKILFAIDLERLWNKQSIGLRKKIGIAKNKRTFLNKTIQAMNKHKKVLENHYFSIWSCPSYPSIVTEPFKDSVNSLQESLAIATAYRDLLDDEIAKEKGAYTTKHHPIWKTIYKPIASIIHDAQTINPELKYESHISLTAKLMATVYPWHWGKDAQGMNHIKAEKHIRAGCKTDD
ncbi:MAG: hypothetical protein PHF56_20305 [Desulfuromonadaceae bacterium]|nr:hypothetical protein [Desulfuromonadaceae bacterium]